MFIFTSWPVTSTGSEQAIGMFIALGWIPIAILGTVPCIVFGFAAAWVSGRHFSVVKHAIMCGLAASIIFGPPFLLLPLFDNIITLATLPKLICLVFLSGGSAALLTLLFDTHRFRAKARQESPP
jgi:hypothetical protein